VHWDVHKSPEGVPYFFCKKTGESRWEIPCGSLDIVTEAAAPAAGPPQDSIKDRIGEPESWESIGRTGWLRVETEKGFTYFFHKKKKLTAWTCPPEIAREVAELDGVLGAAEPEAPEKGGADTEDMAAQIAAQIAAQEEEEAAEAEPAKPTKAERAELREKQVAMEQLVAREKEKLRNFKQLLLEKGVKPFDKYEKWLPKLMHDSRFTAVTGQKERKLLFDALAKKIDKERQKVQAATKRSGREAFKELLTKAQESGVLKERTAEKALQVMERRFEDDDRWDAVPEKDRERMVTELWEEVSKREQKEREEAQSGFKTMVLEAIKGREDDPPSLSRLRSRLQDDPRWEPVESSERERMYDRIVRELEDAKRKRKRKASQVEQEAEEARKSRKLTEGEERIISFFSEKFKNPFTMEWGEVQDQCKDSAQLKNCGLKEEEQVRAWLEYRQKSTDARRETWVHILTNAGFDVVGPELEFEQVVQRAFDAKTAKAFNGMPEEVLIKAWEEWRVHAYDLAVEDCQKWLRTCEHLRGCEQIDPTGGDDFDLLLKRLEATDVRFSRLRGRPEEQTRLVAGRLKELRDMRVRARTGLEETEEAE
ncbi:unnamed protein product, partial [Polarella glacialis]